MNGENIHINLLNNIYGIANTAVKRIEEIAPKVESDEFLKVLTKQQNRYQEIVDKALAIHVKYGTDESQRSKIMKIAEDIIMMLKTIKNDDQAYAKILLESEHKASIELLEELNSYSKEDQEITILAEELLKVMTNNNEDLKGYL